MKLKLTTLPRISSLVLKQIHCTWYTSSEAISYAVGFVSRKRLFSTEAQMGFLAQSKKGFFDSTFFD